jgi:hypothetical protein
LPLIYRFDCINMSHIFNFNYQQIMYLFYYQQVLYLFYYQQIMYLFCLFYYQQIMYLFSLLSYIRSIARNKMKRHLNSMQYENTMRTNLVRNCINIFPLVWTNKNNLSLLLMYLYMPVPGEVMYMCVYLC